nr:hypothetical protein Itr_chr06CG09800 [Ipomoea trifida]
MQGGIRLGGGGGSIVVTNDLGEGRNHGSHIMKRPGGVHRENGLRRGSAAALFLLRFVGRKGPLPMLSIHRLCSWITLKYNAQNNFSPHQFKHRSPQRS